MSHPRLTTRPLALQREPLSLTGDAPNGFAGDAYSYAYTLTGGKPPYTVSIESGSLPPDLALVATTLTAGQSPSIAGILSAPVVALENFIFGPVTSDGTTLELRASNSAFTTWATPETSLSFSSLSYGPGLSLFSGPDGSAWAEYNDFGYYYTTAIGTYEGAPPELPFGPSSAMSFYGTNNAAGIGRDVSTPPFLRNATPIAAAGTRWWALSQNNLPMYTDDYTAFGWTQDFGFPSDLSVISIAARSGIVVCTCRSTTAGNSSNRLVWTTNNGASWNNVALSGGGIETHAVAVSPTQVYWAAGGAANFSNGTALGTSPPTVGGAFQKRRAWWTGTSWLVERVGTPMQIQRYTDLSTTGTSVFTFPAGTTPCGSFLALGGGLIVVPVLLSTPANHVDFYISSNDGVSFTLLPDMRINMGVDTDEYGYAFGFSIAYKPPA